MPKAIVQIERSTICRWVHEYGSQIAKRLRPHFRQTCTSWRLDETLVKIKGRWYYLYRAIDKYGNTLDWMLSRQQNAKAAMRFFKRKRRYLGRYFAPPMMQNRRAKRDDYKPSAALVTGHYVP
ncbi:hypothetical protein A0O36_02902 [Piscirickettsiaceae bacterium NZ-RLO1]|nr:hypothetical protein A0O36_02902 [Piscirickettsiaceae bacterium NZ-RLO1]